MAQAIKAKQVSSLGETPAEARRRMQSSSGGGETKPPLGEEVETLTPAHMAAIRDADEGFKDTSISDGPVEDVEERIEPPSPERAMAMIRQLGQEKLQLRSELDASLAKLQRYEAQFGAID